MEFREPNTSQLGQLSSGIIGLEFGRWDERFIILQISRVSQIGAELRNQYIIVYEPTNTSVDGHFRAIEVRLTGKLGERPWQVRTRRGYVAARDSRG